MAEKPSPAFDRCIERWLVALLTVAELLFLAACAWVMK